MTESARIAALQPPYPADTGAMLAKWMPPGSAVEPLSLFRTLAIHQDLFSRMRPLGAGILGSGVVDAALREALIHRTCALCRCEYEWGVHAASFGEAVGLTDEQLASTVHGSPDDACWDPRQRAVLRLADELHSSARVSDDLFRELSRLFDTAQILELTVTAGWYHTIAFAVGVMGLAPEAWAARFPAA